MRFPTLSPADALTAAKVQGHVALLLVGAGKSLYADRGVAEVHAITRDPRILGHVRGVFLARVEQEHPYNGPAAELLQLAGADEVAAQEMLEWLRAQVSKRRPSQPFSTPGDQPAG